MLDSNTIIVVIIVAAITFFSRVVPFIFFRKGEVPKILMGLEKDIPGFILTLLVFYCLKGVSFVYSPYGIPELGSLALVALLHILWRNALLSIVLGSAVYLLIVNNLLM